MGNFIRKNLVTILILGATLVLAGIAVFTAIRLYQLRQQPVAPTAPTSKPAAQEATTCSLTFSLALATPTPTPTPLPGCYETCTTPGSQSNCPTGLTCQTISGSNICVNPSCPSNSNCVCATPTPTPTPTPGVPNTCNGTCGSDNNCASGLTCYITSGTSGVCRNPSCITSANCVCATTTPTPTPIALATPTPTPVATPQLPTAGVSTPTWVGIGIGSILLIGAMLLAL